MFRIVCFVEDRNLAKVLHATAGLVLNMEPPQPVTNAVLVKPQIEQASAATSIKGRFTEYLSTIKGDKINIIDMRKKWVELGGLPSSLNGTLLIQITKEGLLKRVARGHYYVI